MESLSHFEVLEATNLPRLPVPAQQDLRKSRYVLGVTRGSHLHFHYLRSTSTLPYLWREGPDLTMYVGRYTRAVVAPSAASAGTPAHLHTCPDLLLTGVVEPDTTLLVVRQELLALLVRAWQMQQPCVFLRDPID